MIIKKVTEEEFFDENKPNTPGEYFVDGGRTFLRCPCGETLDVTNWVKKDEPLHLEPSVLHFETSKTGERITKCHFFIHDGKYVPA